MRPHVADNTESLVFWSLDRISRNASMLFKCGVMIDMSTILNFKGKRKNPIKI